MRELCDKYNVLWIGDEIQTGIGRCGKMLAVEWEEVKPDLLTLGKSLSGGLLPISATLANDEIMNVLVPGSHGSTYGGNPLSAAVCQAALDVVVDEKLVENSLSMGEYLLEGLKTLVGPKVETVRGRGLMCAVQMKEGFSAWTLCLDLASQGLLAKPTHGSTIRLTPPLIITKPEIDWALDVVKSAIDRL